MEELTFEERIAMEINEDREFWLDNINCHLDKLLENVNGDNQLLRHMAQHYQAQNMIANVKVKQL